MPKRSGVTPTSWNYGITLSPLRRRRLTRIAVKSCCSGLLTMSVNSSVLLNTDGTELTKILATRPCGQLFRSDESNITQSGSSNQGQSSLHQTTGTLMQMKNNQISQDSST